MHVNSQEPRALLDAAAIGRPSLKACHSQRGFKTRMNRMPGRDKHSDRVRHPLKRCTFETGGNLLCIPLRSHLAWAALVRSRAVHMIDAMLNDRDTAHSSEPSCQIPALN